MPDKVIISNNGALIAKYGVQGFAAINAAIQGMITADAAKGITTQYIPLDDAGTMNALGGVAVSNPADQQAVKAAIDAIYVGADKPDYLMILGSVDVVPHQELVNPVFDRAHPQADPDRLVPSDLPYACDVPFSSAADDFIGPSRVVGRLPDLTGGTNAADFVRIIQNATDSTPIPAGGIGALGITAQAWQVSTDLSLQALFGPGVTAMPSPVKGPQWPTPLLNSQIHFINCHGALDHPQFHGEPNNYPVAHDAVWITNRITPGTIAAVECCYGAQLYDPAAAAGQMSVGNTYMSGGAAAYLGSTTIAYGPAASMAYADLICRFFIEGLLAGKSSGDALLNARLRYVQASMPTDPVDLKTLAQFLLLGDPSLHPVVPAQPQPGAAVPHAMATATATASASASAVDQSPDARKARRQASKVEATEIETSHPVSDTAIAVPADVQPKMQEYIDRAGLKSFSMTSFATTLGRGGLARAKGFGAQPQNPLRVHLAIGERTDVNRDQRINYPVAIVAVEDGGTLQVETVYGKARRTRTEWYGGDASGRRRVEERAPGCNAGER